METTTLTPPAETISARTLASSTRSDRNRAIDAYRALAMLAVAIGHWAAMAVGTTSDGEMIADNALRLAPGMSWMTWILQVMPLFFVVGGFSSAMSLDSWTARNGTIDRGRQGRLRVAARPQDWVAARLRRMLAPTVALATTWAAIIAIGLAAGQGALVAVGATAAAIPLWFLANYTIDTAIAPYVLPLFRRHPVGLPVAGIGLFLLLEGARFAGIPALPHLNWVLGWLLFQIAGFAWRDGLLPSARSLAVIAAGLWSAAIAAVTIGPWPVSMVHFPGLENSPTHPPSLALLLFGAAYSATAVAIAPTVSRWLERSPRAWTAVVGANAVAMSVYLWHFTAAIAATAIFHVGGWLPTATVGTADWWMQKLPLMGAATVILIVIVARVAKIEQRALLAPRRPWVGLNRRPAGQLSLLACAGVLSVSLKQWAHGEFVMATICIALTLVLWHGVIKVRASSPARLTPPSYWGSRCSCGPDH